MGHAKGASAGDKRRSHQRMVLRHKAVEPGEVCRRELKESAKPWTAPRRRGEQRSLGRSSPRRLSDTCGRPRENRPGQCFQGEKGRGEEAARGRYLKQRQEIRQREGQVWGFKLAQQCWRKGYIRGDSGDTWGKVKRPQTTMDHILHPKEFETFSWWH